MPQIPLQETFQTPDGQTALQHDGPDAPPITAKDALVIAATTELPEDGQASPTLVQDKLKRFSIWQKLQNTEKEFVHFTSEEAAHLKQRVARIFGIVIAGPLMHLLDGKRKDGTDAPVPTDAKQ